jgi:hypothetical protein
LKGSNAISVIILSAMPPLPPPSPSSITMADYITANTTLGSIRADGYVMEIRSYTKGSVIAIASTTTLAHIYSVH